MARPTRCNTCPDCVHPREPIWCEAWGNPDTWAWGRLRERDRRDLSRALANIEADPAAHSLSEIAAIAGRASEWISGA